MEEVLLFLLSCIGVINALILSIYFLYMARPGQVQSKFLALLFLMLSVRIGKSVIFYFFEDINHLAFYLQIGLSACFFIGPCLYFYVCSFFKEKMFIPWWVQLIFFGSLISLTGWLYPYLDNIELWRFYLIQIIYFQWFVYLVLSGYIAYKNLRKNHHKTVHFTKARTWILSIILGVGVVWLAYATCQMTSYLVGAVSFTFVVYIIVLLLLMKVNKPSLLNGEYVKYGGKNIEASEATAIYHSLLSALEKEHTNAQLKLDDLAESIKVKKHLISQVLNEHYQTNFSRMLRQFRVEKVKQLLLSNDQFTLEAIGEECGFKAKSSFYTAFKQETGLTPAQFRKKQTQKSSDL